LLGAPIIFQQEYEIEKRLRSVVQNDDSHGGIILDQLVNQAQSLGWAAASCRAASELAHHEAPVINDELDRAHRVASGCAEPDDLRWLSKGFTAFLAGGGSLPLERCLRLARNESTLRRMRRDYWLRRAWMLLNDRLSPWRRSEALSLAVGDFESRKWPRWRTLEVVPDRANEIEGALFNAFRTHERVPRTAMQLHNIACHRQHS
jgi:hypothetical protein